MKLGDAFLMPHPRQSYAHLWFVISDPKLHSGTFVIANVTTDELRSGKECKLLPHDHPWITKQCFMNFADAMEIDSEKGQCIDKLIGTLIVMQDCLDPPVLAKIVQAAKTSKAIPVKLRKYL
jgi:hypothetical protein